MDITKKYISDLTYKILGCAIEVHKHLGPGLIESVYEKCFIRELELKGIRFRQQVWVPIEYKGIKTDGQLRLDVLVENLICVELKAQEAVLPIHEAVLMSYMRLLEKPKGILINFHCQNIFKQGQKTFINHLFNALPDE